VNATELLQGRVRPEVKRMAEAMAKAENRSLTNWLECAVERLYQQQSDAPPPSATKPRRTRRQPAPE
jgi:hypothetical protein